MPMWIARFIVVCLLALAAIGAHAQSTPEATAEPLPAPTEGFVYQDTFDNAGRINLTIGVTRYPQWGSSDIEDGQLCNETPQGDYFDTLPLPIYAENFRAEMVVTAYDDFDTSIGFAIGDFNTQAYDLLFLMNDFQGVWRIERWYYPQEPGLQQRSSVRSDEPLWTVETPFRFTLESADGVYRFFIERDGERVQVAEDTFTPAGRQIALAVWGSVNGPRRVCFDSVTITALP